MKANEHKPLILYALFNLPPYTVISALKGLVDTLYPHLPHFIFIFYFIYLATGAGSPQQREPITVGPYYLSLPVNFPCGRKPEYAERTHDFRQSVDFTLFT